MRSIESLLPKYFLNIFVNKFFPLRTTFFNSYYFYPPSFFFSSAISHFPFSFDFFPSHKRRPSPNISHLLRKCETNHNAMFYDNTIARLPSPCGHYKGEPQVVRSMHQQVVLPSHLPDTTNSYLITLLLNSWISKSHITAYLTIRRTATPEVGSATYILESIG